MPLEWAPPCTICAYRANKGPRADPAKGGSVRGPFERSPARWFPFPVTGTDGAAVVGSREFIVNDKYAGVSVTSSNIEASVRPTGEHWTAQAGDAGIAEIAGRLQETGPQVVVLAANGRRELPVAGRLVTEGLRCAFVPPLQVRDFARTIGRASHLSHKEAEILAYFAELVQPVERSLSDDQVTHLRAIERRRSEIREMIELERSRWTDAVPIVRRDLRLHVQFLERNLQAIEEEFNLTVRSSPIWR